MPRPRKGRMRADKRALVERLQATVPAAMRERKHWLLWRFELKGAETKPRKMPYWASGRRRRGTQGDQTDRDELATFDVALAEFGRGTWDGLGFAFLPGDDLFGIDVDGAVDPDTGEFSSRWMHLVEACASYTEWSPSRTGVHVIMRGDLGGTTKDNGIGLELFQHAQFFTVTGERWDSLPPDVQEADDALVRRLRATVEAARQARRKPTSVQPSVQPPAQASPPPSPAARAGSGGGDDFQRVNDAAMANLDAWVLSLYPGAVKAANTGGYRVSSRELGRDLQEDLTITPTGIVDWGVADMGDPKQGRRTPIDLVVERQGAKPKDAMLWLAGRVGVTVTPRPARADKPKPGRSPARPSAQPVDGVDTPSPGSAEEGEGDEADLWRDELLRSSSGGKKDCRENVYIVLTHHPVLKGLIGYDEFAHRVMKLRRPPWDSELGEWTTNDDYLLGFWLAQHERLVIKGESTIVAGVAMAAYGNRYHPVLQYLDGLPAWDGVERLANWMHDCLGAEDSEYTRLVGCWFLMGMVQRVRQPGCQMDYMIVLEGLQGKQKSTALRTLVGNDEWFADTPIRIGDKDAMLSLAGKWLYEVGEMDSFNRAETTAVKQYVSSRVDRVREPFARRPCDRPRSGVFAGSTNQSEYFKDPTGARRFWPVACDGDIRLDLLAASRDQLYAEAMARLASADPEQRRYWPTREETETWLVPQQERREIVDPWYERLAIWLDSSDIYGETGNRICDVEHFTSHELLVRALNVPTDRIDGGRQMATRVGIAMHKLGWDKRRDATGARLHRYWRPKVKAQRPALDAPRTSDTSGVPGGVPEELFHD